MSYDANTTASELVSNYADKIKGKTVLTTGASPGGLGGLFVEAIAKASPALLILAGRSLAKLQQTADAISAAQPAVRVRLLKIDLESFQSVQDAAATVNGWTDVPAIDVLVNNAGLMAVDYGVSSDGFERQFAANHLGPFLFTNLIMDKVLASPSPRIVNVSSDAHRLNPIRFADYNFDVCSESSRPEYFNLALIQILFLLQ
jgi:NAD(P)-dependent dehydrogenase (short-subunit alcohol dehydrogenase family)